MSLKYISETNLFAGYAGVNYRSRCNVLVLVKNVAVCHTSKAESPMPDLCVKNISYFQ